MCQNYGHRAQRDATTARLRRALTEDSLKRTRYAPHTLASLAHRQMPRHLISDAHEWINEIPTVPIYYLAKPQPRERAWKNQRGKKTLLSLTLV